MEIQLPSDLTERLEHAGLEFLVEILEVEVAAHPENADALGELGHVYTRLGRLQDGLRVDRQLVGLLPDHPTAHYNLGCSLALVDRLDEALDSLESAVALGYADAAYLARDEDLESLRGDPRFQALIERMSGAHPG